MWTLCQVGAACSHMCHLLSGWMCLPQCMFGELFGSATWLLPQWCVEALDSLLVLFGTLYGVQTIRLLCQWHLGCVRCSAYASHHTNGCVLLKPHAYTLKSYPKPKVPTLNPGDLP